MKRHLVDGLAVVAVAGLIAGCIVSVWAFAVMFACMIAAMLIDPESGHQRARRYRQQQRLRQQERRPQTAGLPPLVVPIKGRVLECGCALIPAQTAYCPADAALREIEQLAHGHD